VSGNGLAAELPPGWRIASLEEVAEVLDRKRVPVNRKEREMRVGDVPYYGATGQVGWIDDYLFDEPLILLGEDGVQFLDPLAAKAYVIRGRSWVNNHAHVLRPRDDIELDYLCHALNAADYRGFVNGTTRLKLTQSSMLKVAIPLPPRDEQTEIARRLRLQLDRIEEGQEAFAEAREGLAAFSRSVLARAVTGSLCDDGDAGNAQEALQSILAERESRGGGRGRGRYV
jgi:type I restriction enzyme, S subunit